MATKLGDLTVAATTGAWALNDVTMTTGSKTVTLRRKSDGAVLATRNFTVQASATAVNFDFGTLTYPGGSASDPPWVAITGLSQVPAATTTYAEVGWSYGSRWGADSFSGNHYSKALGSGVAVRISASARTFYCVETVWAYDENEEAEVLNYALYRVVAGTATLLASGYVTYNYAYLRLQANGTAITASASNAENGTYTTLASVTDSQISGGGPGVAAVSPQGYCTLWWGGDL